MKNIINSTWDTLDLPTKASIMRKSLLKGITDIDVIRKNYDSKYLNVNMLPEVEDNFSRELLYDLYNKVEGNNRSNNMYPSNSYGNLFVDGGYTDDTPLIFEDVFYTDLGSIPTVRGKSNMPSSIQLTKELIKELKKKSHYQSFDYSHLSPDRRPILNPTTFILVPLGYGLNGYQLNNNSGESVTYYIDDSLPPDENGNYILSKLDLDSPIGKTYSDWKMTQEAFKLRMSNPNVYNLSSEDMVTQTYDDNSVKNPEEDYIPLDEVEVLGTSKKGEGDKKEATTSVSTLTSGNGTLELGIPNPYNFKGDEIKVTLGDGSRGVPGAGLFGDKTGTDLIREYDSNGNPVYYYPGYSNGSNGYYYPNPITIKWPDSYNLPDYSSEYDATHDGVPVELLPFIEDDKLNLRDLLAWILTLMNNRNYPAGDDSEFLLPKRSKLISPKQVPTLLEESHVFKNKKSKGGSLNKFPLGGSLLPILTPKYNTDENRRKLANGLSAVGSVFSMIPNPITRGVGLVMTLPATGYDIYDTYQDIKNGADSKTQFLDMVSLGVDALPIMPIKVPKAGRFSSTSRLVNRQTRGAIADAIAPTALTATPNLFQDLYSLFGPNYKNYIDDVGRPFKYSKDWNRFSVELPTVTVTNKFDDGGFTYIPDNQQNMVVDPFEFEGIRYGWLPNGGAGEDVYKEHNDRNGVYVRWDNDNNKWAKTTVPRDLGNIKNYFANRHNELVTYGDNAPAANAYDANSELNRDNIANLLYWDPVNKQIRDKLLTLYLNLRLLTNEDAAKYLTYGLGALGIASGIGAAPGATLLGLAGGMGGAYATDWASQKINGNTWALNMSDWTGLPEWAADLTNPGALIGGAAGAVAGDIGTLAGRLFVSNNLIPMKDRFNYMLLNTTDSPNPIPVLWSSIKLFSPSSQRSRARWNYLTKGEVPENSFNTFNTGTISKSKSPYIADEYYASFRAPRINKSGNVDWDTRLMSRLENPEGEVKHSLIFGEPLNPKIFKYVGLGEKYFGPHAKYIKTHPLYKNAKVYEMNTTTLLGSPTDESFVNKNAVERYIFGNEGSYVARPSSSNVTDSWGIDGSPFQYDGAGNLLEVVKLKDGRYAARRLDIYKFNGKDYGKRWGIKSTLGKLGLNYFDKVTSENVPIVRERWLIFNNAGDVIDTYRSPVEYAGTLNKYNLNENLAEFFEVLDPEKRFRGSVLTRF